MRDDKIKYWEKSLSRILIIKLSPSPICMANFVYLSVSNLSAKQKRGFRFRYRIRNGIYSSFSEHDLFIQTLLLDKSFQSLYVFSCNSSDSL